MNKEEIDILYSFANDEDCRYVYDWQGFNYEGICPLIDKLIKENKKYKEVIDKAIEFIEENMYSYYDNNGEKCIEETVFERSANPKELLNILQDKEVQE